MEESVLRKDVNDVRKNLPPSFIENGKSKCRRLEREREKQLLQRKQNAVEKSNLEKKKT